MTVLEQLRARRTEIRAAIDAIHTRTTEENRDLTGEELADLNTRSAEAREVDDKIEELHAQEIAELRAAAVRRPGPATPREPVLTREHSVYDWAQTRGLITEAEQPPSFDRYLRGIATGRWDGAEQERALSEGTLTAGGHLVPTPLSARVIDLARNSMRVMQAGSVTVPMTAATLKLARLTVEGTPAGHAENAAITDVDMTFDSVTFTARALTRVVKLSVELFEDADPSSEDVIANAFAGQMAV